MSYSYLLEEGATTLRGEHAKLAKPPRCVFPARLSCNYGDGFDRCEFMEYSGDHSTYGSNWTCTAAAKKRGKDKSDT